MADASAPPGMTPEEWRRWSAEAVIDGQQPVDDEGWIGAPPSPPGIPSDMFVDVFMEWWARHHAPLWEGIEEAQS